MYGKSISPSKSEIKSYERHLHADKMACKWLGDANEAEERGAIKTAEKCLAKAQYWLDKLNQYENR